MTAPHLPLNETERLKALGNYNLLDTLPEEDFDNITYLASVICQTPISLISLIDKDRQFFKSHLGIDINQTHKDLSFCAHAINQPQTIFEVEDARLDDRFHDNDFVTGEPNIAFYAGIPLVDADGFALGTLCVIDQKPRKLTAEQKEALTKLSKQVMFIIEARQKNTIEEELKLVDFTFNNSAMPIFLVKEDSSIYNINDAAASNLGYSKEELKGKKIIELDNNFDRDRWALHWAEIKTKGSLTIETTLKKKDGTINNLVVYINYLKHGDLELICSYLTDITQKKKQEEQMNLVNFAFKNSTTPINILNKDGSVFEFNEAAHELLGYTKEEYKSISVPDIDPDYQHNIWPIHWEELKKAKSLSFETTLKKKNGDIINANTEANFIQYGDKELNCVFFTDITEKKKVERQLNLLDYSYKHTDSAMFFLDVNGLYIDFNQATANMLGYSCEEFRGKTLMDVNPMVTKESWEERWEEFKEIPNQNFLVKLKRKDGKLIDVEVKTNSIELNGIVVHFGFYKDITEKKKLEERSKLIDFSFRNSYIAKLLLRSDGTIHHFNIAMSSLLDYTEEEFSKMNLLDIETGMDEPSCIAHWNEIRKNKNLISNCQFKKKDGTILDVEVRNNLINYDELEVNFCFITDITEKKKIEENLKLSAFTIENAAWGLAYIKADGTIYNCNLAFAKMYGISSSEEIKTRTAFDFDSGYTTETWKKYWDELKQKKSLHYIVKRTKKDGTIVFMEINANMIQFGDLELNCAFVYDVTDKLKAEEDLKQSNQRNEFASLATSDIIWEADLLKKETFISKNFTTIFGHPVGDGWMPMDNNIWMQNINPDDIDIILLDRNAVLNSKESNNKWVGEYRLRKADGSYATVKDKTFAIKDEEGRIIRMVGAMQDITKQRVEEERLRLMESVILNTNDAVLITEAEPIDKPGPRILFGNKAFEKMTGYSLEELIGNSPRMFQNEETDRKELDKFRDALEKWESSDVKLYNSKKNGEKYWVNIRTTPLANDEGWFTHWISIERDVTKEKQEEERLRLMELAILNTNDAILITEAVPINEPGPVIVFVNDAFCNITGYSKEEVIGKNPRMLQCEETDRNELNKFREKLEKWEHTEMTVINKKKNGDKFWVNIVATPLSDDKGWFTHWIGVQRDVTKEIENAREKEKLLKELVENNLELKQFSYITSHNLRAPLTNLVSICNIIKPSIGTDALTLQLIDGFKTSTHHLNETLNDLIEVLIIKENRNIRKDQLTFEEIFKKIKESLSISLVEHKVIINADFSAAPAVIFANEYLESVFLNLLTNAVKYRHPDRDPIITIKTSKETNGDTKLTFSDNGIGINMAYAKDKIFGLYKRFHNNADSKGIGLYLIHSQITTLGGNIEVESEVNIGTTFTINFK